MLIRFMDRGRMRDEGVFLGMGLRGLRGCLMQGLKVCCAGAKREAVQKSYYDINQYLNLDSINIIDIYICI